jgi:hypothetical protein
MDLKDIKAATPMEVLSVYLLDGEETLLVTAELLATYAGFKLLESVCTVDPVKRAMSFSSDKKECCEMLRVSDCALRVHSVMAKSIDQDGVLKWNGLSVSLPVPTVEVGIVFQVPTRAVDSLVLASWVCKHYSGDPSPEGIVY